MTCNHPKIPVALRESAGKRARRIAGIVGNMKHRDLRNYIDIDHDGEYSWPVVRVALPLTVSERGYFVSLRAARLLRPGEDGSSSVISALDLRDGRKRHISKIENDVLHHFECLAEERRTQ
ncbi:hypothetical protein FIU86_04370 [Roseovarius sp. THAF9]|uniref:hypothetical protein n=1 Tax=Roseovarius sp. THAF9 TaxID=2587847 RepID=UPI0012694079|nr:hypothetical protein [Roseovarius sp. THAF9]QFT92066.1 hypothetical protein FIU86_04370 [Roseovarius sp. THAF9]